MELHTKYINEDNEGDVATLGYSIRLKNDEKIFENDKQQQIIKAIENDDFKQLKEILNNGWMDDGSGLILASIKGNEDMVKILIPHSNVSMENRRALVSASSYNHVGVVKTLLNYCNARENDSMALYVACARGNMEVVKTLLPVSDVLAKNGRALMVACENGHEDIARLLLLHINMKQIIDGAMELAVILDDCSMIDLLFDYCERDKIVEKIENMNVGRGASHFLMKCKGY